MAPARSIRIRLYASAREAVGAPTLDWPVPSSGIEAATLIDRLGVSYPDLRPTLRTSRFVRNGEYLTDLRRRLRPGDEFAVHPPYGGG